MLMKLGGSKSMGICSSVFVLPAAAASLHLLGRTASVDRTPSTRKPRALERELWRPQTYAEPLLAYKDTSQRALGLPAIGANRPIDCALLRLNRYPVALYVARGCRGALVA